MAPVLGYWKLRGLSEHIKYLLEYTGTEHSEKIYNFGPPPDYDRSEWLTEKFNLGLDFPNLPYYIDGEVKITQSNAILRYIARKHNLMGKTEEETMKADMLENETMDLRMGLGRICYDPNFEKLKGPYMKETMPVKLEQLSKFLGDNNWFLGDKIRYVDFFLYEAMDALRLLSPTCLDKLDTLKAFMARFESLDAIKKYMSTDRFKKTPFSAPTASFGGKCLS